VALVIEAHQLNITENTLFVFLVTVKAWYPFNWNSCSCKFHSWKV